ncbi:hypothetical protein [uncultured Jannaschia sp.]|uniref:hypothetical protein n=1 Tax=uncultured Jannaschia sp. TaxID=293347 RepID=UPI00260F9D02|nr:hypothetical protein [uncultured Jannaschia sp.]
MLIGLAVTIGAIAGFGPGKLAIFAIAVAVVAQLAYVGAIALMAYMGSRDQREVDPRPREPGGASVSPPKDT